MFMVDERREKARPMHNVPQLFEVIMLHVFLRHLQKEERMMVMENRNRYYSQCQEFTCCRVYLPVGRQFKQCANQERVYKLRRVNRLLYEVEDNIIIISWQFLGHNYYKLFFRLLLVQST